MLFEQLVRLVKDYRDYVSRYHIDVDTYVNNFTSNFLKFVNKLKINDPNFVDKNAGVLYMIHELMVGEFAKIYLKQNKETMSRLRSAHDKFFAMFNIKMPGRRFAKLPTILATQFCKGITFFDNNTGIQEEPFYHRDASCGSRSKSATEKFASGKDKAFLKNCYIERKIYDLIYINTKHMQDMEHLVELRTIERMYQDEFKYENMKIDVSYFDDDVNPCCLTILTSKGNKLRQEIYKRSLSNRLVNCKMIDYDGKIYEKTQTDSNEESWIKNS